MSRMGWTQRPHSLHALQAAAAIGQMGLVRAYEACFMKHGLHTAQVLLTRDDLADRQRYLNARSTLRTLLSMGVIPVVNENDTVATDELRFGTGARLVEYGALALPLQNAIQRIYALQDSQGPALWEGDQLDHSQIVGEVRDLLHLGARRELQLVHGDHRAFFDLHHLGREALVVLQHREDVAEGDVDLDLPGLGDALTLSSQYRNSVHYGASWL